MTSKQTPKKGERAKKKKAPAQLTLNQMNPVEALTDKQEEAFEAFDEGRNLVLRGSAGTGKTLVALAAAYHEVLDQQSSYKKVAVIRSAVPTRDIGHLPGDQEEKVDIYTLPYISITNELFKSKGAWEKGIARGQIEFHSTSYIRGLTFRDTIIIVDEIQNLSEHELDSVITRLGHNCRIIFAGDYHQSDFTKDRDKKGLASFLKVLDKMKSFSIVEFGPDDIVRSGLVKEYILLKEAMDRANSDTKI